MRCSQNGKVSVLQKRDVMRMGKYLWQKEKMGKCLCGKKRYGQNGKVPVAKREMRSEWESVCVAKETCG